MKKLFILIVMCVVGMVLPQRMLAADYSFYNLKITISDDGVVTIESDEAGTLSETSFNSQSGAIQAIANATGEIKFKGKFNQDDLDRLKSIKVHGTNYECCVQKKVDMSEAEFPNGYQQMTFKNWAATLQEAVTSQYADNNISNDIFQNCKSLTKVDFLAGTVKGFTDHNEQNGYAAGLNVTIGKNVTSIDGSALKGSTVQTVTFDKDFEEGETPKNLTIGESAFEECYNLTAIEFPNRVTNIGPSAFKEAGTSANEFSVSFERREVSQGASVDYDVDLTIGASAFQNCTTIKTLSLPIRLTTLGVDAFAGTTNLTTVEIREDVEDARLTVIPTGAFLNSGITSITIPRSVTRIKSGAFQECLNLETITFQESHQDPQPDLVIETRAFAGGQESQYKLKDVFVDIDPAVRKLICEYDAFPFVSLVGQTDVTNDQKATLHFSEDYWNYYAGDWKKGLSFGSQNALNGIKDGCDTSTGVPQNAYFPKNPGDVESSGGYVEGRQPANGWQQFAVTSTNIDIIIPPGEFIRTYSTSTAYDLPEHVRIFRVINFSDGYVEGQNANDQALADAAQKIAITREVTGYIPKNTGLIMVGTVSEKAVLYYFKENSGTDVYLHSKHDVSNPAVANLLEPTLDNDQFPLAPVWRYANNKIEYRNFGMLKTDHKFGRAKFTTMRKNYAYLKIPAELFHWSNESINGSSSYAEENTIVPAKISVVYSFDDFNEDNYGITTAIKKAIDMEMNSSNSYYTLQGVKVSSPNAKGIYIVNGKKVVFK